jgi:hypothetical protein
MHSQRWDLEHFKQVFYYHVKTPKPKIPVSFGAVTYKNFDALEQSSTQFDVGSNFFLDGHHAKITAQYSTRPVYSLTNRSGSLRTS